MRKITFVIIGIIIVFLGLKIYWWEKRLMACGGENNKGCPPSFVCDFGQERLVPLPNAWGVCRLQILNKEIR